MKRYKLKAVRTPVITAVQITDSNFDNPHPNPEHVIGVAYDPVERYAIIDRFFDEQYGKIGNWLLCKDNLPDCFINNREFERNYEEDLND